MLYVTRLLTGVLAILAFIPSFNPVRASKLVSDQVALFTSAVSYSSLTKESEFQLRSGIVDSTMFILINVAAIVLIIGILGMVAGACLSLGNINLKRLSLIISAIGGVVGAVGCVLVFVAKGHAAGLANGAGEANLPKSLLFYMISIIIILLISVICFFIMPGFDADEGFYMESTYKLFLMFLPFGVLAFLFCYLPLWGWRYAFFDYEVGGTIGMKNFVGFKWFGYLFKTKATRNDVFQTIINTLAMSSLGLIFSWLPMAFAIFLCEIKNLTFRRFVQTFTTVPNFISWVLVYALALSLFDTTGFINQLKVYMGIIKDASEEGTNYLMSTRFIWFKMWAWGTWKGIGWSAIIYIAGISGIDQQLYEAATVDGAGRFQKMWHVTLPGLLPTFFVLLLMSIAAILSNGLDQYLVFENARNANKLSVLDLYVYHLGLGSNGSIPLSTVVGMFKSIISVILLFGANSASKALRGESII
ncbi:MAG: ABC transporter permease subunit [Lachnospiraceae bacterium]|nr:ABC transporter permease subunit [Lachnospiraceae bacterium]